MSKEKAPAFQFYAAEYLADINVELMTIEDEGCYIRLLAFCWREGSLPNDPEDLAKLCKGVKPTLRVLSCFKPTSDTRILHPRLESERKKRRDFVIEARKAGYKSAAKRWGYNGKHDYNEPYDSVTKNGNQHGNQKVTLQSSSSSSTSTASSSIGIAKSAIPSAVAKKNGHAPDEAFDLFAAIFKDHYQTPYGANKGDFVMLAQLRKRLELQPRQAPGDWEKACRNYIESPSGKHSLADLAHRYEVFRNGHLDRFGKPPDKHSMSVHEANQQTLAILRAERKAENEKTRF